MYGLALWQRVERVEADPLVQQHTIMIEVPDDARVTACYDGAKSIHSRLKLQLSFNGPRP
jgi:hypothetical protein